ncbi:MAG TPA: CAP domain-containing protein [Terriglobales bacterium]|nr:CAP domain-containing protein [Terriglobales bacterium]
MRRLIVVALLTFCLAGSASAQQSTNPWATIPRPPHAASAAYNSQAERQLLALANQARAEAGLAPLELEEGLTRAARRHSALMASEKQLSHELPGEPSLPERLAATSTLDLGAEGENVGLAASVAEVHRGFMQSPHHRENLLNPDYNVAGFAAVREGNRVYVTEDFGQSRPRHRGQ